MFGTLFNVITILIGGILGITFRQSLSESTQLRLRNMLGIGVLYVGASTSWKAIVDTPTFWLWDLLLVMLALILGNVIGKLLRIQKTLNRLGTYAEKQFSEEANKSKHRFSEGFITATLLFCIGPMAILGPIQDGLNGNPQMLIIKSVMDGIATMLFVPTLGWGVMVSALPVGVYQGSISLMAQHLASFLSDTQMIAPLNAVGGFLIICVSVLVFGFRKAPVADYLPGLLVAPMLYHLTG